MVRRRHNVIVFALVLLLALTVCQVSAWSAHRKPKHLPGFHLVKKKLPKTMVAGSTYEMAVDFQNPKRENFTMNVTLEITEKQFPMGSEEFSVTGTLYAWETPPKHRHHTRHQEYRDVLTFEEVKAGVFSNSTVIVHGKTHNHLTLRISSVPNLMPDTYTFTLTVTLWFDLPSQAVEKLEKLKTEINALPDAFFEEPEEIKEIKEDLVEDINEIIEEINEGDYKEAIKELKDLKKEIRKEIVPGPERDALIKKIKLTIKILKSLSRGRP